MRAGRALIAVSLVISSLAACGGGDTMKVIIDSDGAFDDMKAILYLLQQPDVEIGAITFSGTGIAHCPAAAENASALLERIDGPDIPIACGRSTPIEGSNSAPEAWRAATDTLGGVTLPGPRPLSSKDAPTLLRDAIDAAGKDAVVVALGPLTNFAEALIADPTTLDQVRMMYLMGGAVDAGGNVLYGNAEAEFNIWADPVAAQMVFATEVPLTLVPLDATNHLPVTPYLYDAVEAHRDSSAVAAFTAEYLEATPFVGGLYHWDELAAVVATDESVVTTEERRLTITDDGETIETAQGKPTRVAVSADRTAFESHFYPAIIGTEDTGIPQWEPDAVLAWDGTTCTYAGPDPLPDEFYIRLDHSGQGGFLSFSMGIYDPGATVADFEAALATGLPEPPPWWNDLGVIGVTAGAREVWLVRGGSTVTGLCYIDPSHVWEVAGPRLPE